MTQRHIGTLLDRKAINDINDNFTELYDEYVGAGLDAAEAKEKAIQAVADALLAKEIAEATRDELINIIREQTAGGDIVPEVVRARGDEPDLGSRLNSIDQDLAQTATDMKQRKVNICQPPYNANSSMDDISLIVENVVNDLVDGGTIYFPTTFKLKNTVNIRKSNIFLEFAPNARIDFEPSINQSMAFRFIGTEGTLADVTENVNMGSTTVVVSSSMGLAVGDWVLISTDELIESENARDYDTKREFAKISSISNNILTFHSPLVFNYKSNLNTKVTKQNFLKNVGVSGLTLQCFGVNLHKGVIFDRCFKPVIYNSSIYDTGSIGIEFRHSIFGGAYQNLAQVDYNDELQYGIVVHSSSLVTVTDNQVYSARTSIDVTRLSTFIVVANNTSYRGSINTHTSKFVTINDNSIHGGGILVRGTKIIVDGNQVYRTISSCIDVSEAADLGDIKITNNLFVGNFSMRVFADNLTFSNNDIRASTFFLYDNRTSFIRFDRDRKNIKISDNNFICERAEPITVGIHLWGGGDIDNVVITGNSFENVGTGLSMSGNSIANRSGLTIEGNNIKAHNRGINIGRFNRVKVTGNQITGYSQLTEGIRFAVTEEYKGFIINGNIIENTDIPIRFQGNANMAKKVIIKDNLLLNNASSMDLVSLETDSSVVSDNI